MNGNNVPDPWSRENRAREPIRLGVSSCLLGAEVRYDGGHKRDRYLAEVLGEFFEWVSVCPEVELGLGVPRPPIRLVRDQGMPRLVEPESGDDLTGRMESYARERIDRLKEVGLDGFILKIRSPTCGIEGVEVFGTDRSTTRDGVGIFARVLLERWPDLPVAEDGLLQENDRLRDFIAHVLSRYRRRATSRRGLDPQQSAELHAVHERLLAHISHDLA